MPVAGVAAAATNGNTEVYILRLRGVSIGPFTDAGGFSV
jgi:hypothetical protein